MFEERARLIIQDKYVELMGNIIDKLKELSLSSIADDVPTTALDTDFDNLWDVFVEQVQRDEDTELYRACSDLINDLCHQSVEPLTIMELHFLWLTSEACNEWVDETEEFPQTRVLVDDVSEELMSWIEQEAEDPELSEADDLHYDDNEELML